MKVEVEAEGRDGVVKLLRPRYFRKPLPRSVFSDYTQVPFSVEDISPDFIRFVKLNNQQMSYHLGY